MSKAKVVVNILSAMMAALIADLFILRPTAMFLTQLARRFQSGRIAPRPAE